MILNVFKCLIVNKIAKNNLAVSNICVHTQVLVNKQNTNCCSQFAYHKAVGLS